MIDCRVDRELDYVIDSSPDVVPKLARLACDFLDIKSPGFGITHDATMDPEPIETDNPDIVQASIHSFHTELVLAALESIRPQIHFDRPLLEPLWLPQRYSSAHQDPIVEAPLGRYEFEKLFTVLRLHTTDKTMGADVTLAYTAPGAKIVCGDRGLFIKDGEASEQALAYGYDGQRMMWDTDLFKAIETGGYDPLIFGPNIYHYVQEPLSTVAFCTRSMVGPRAAHVFCSINPSVSRTTLRSDIPIYTQELD
jgi:hypothetical protein